jgi:GNAT superfamily N-acetyltransferase
MVSESPRFSKFAFAIEKAIKLFEYLDQNGGLFVAVNRDEIIGFFAGIITEHYLSFDRCAQDIGVYVVPEHRGSTAFPRLIYAFEDWAKQHGVTDLVLGVSTGILQDQTVCMYERMGYKIASYGLVKVGA